MSNERIPVHSAMDSSIPPIIAPMRFEPNASAGKPCAAKLRMNTIPAKNTGRHSTRVEVSTFIQGDGSKNFCSGME